MTKSSSTRQENLKDPSQSERKRTYTVEEIRDILGISAPTAYRLVSKNFFRSVKVGRYIRISKKSFDEWLDSQSGDWRSANG